MRLTNRSWYIDDIFVKRRQAISTPSKLLKHYKLEAKTKIVKISMKIDSQTLQVIVVTSQ